MDDISIKIDVSIKQCLEDLHKLKQNQIPFAISLGLNSLAFDAKRDVQYRLPQIFDRPTPFTVNSMYVVKSHKKQNPIAASLGFKYFASKGTPAAKYLMHHTTGGGRAHKKAEESLIRAGRIAGNKYLVPGPAADLNQYGNIKHSEMGKMLSALEASWDSAANSKGAKRAAFIMSRSGKTILKRVTSGRTNAGSHFRTRRMYMPFMFVTDQPHYSKSLDLQSIVDRYVDRAAPWHFDSAIQRAIDTAR